MGWCDNLTIKKKNIHFVISDVIFIVLKELANIFT